ncbi:MAG: response regulator [Acidobacteria bacterium]|nr:response regulator [Acidobacteriota bacterium]MBI3280052.1 response regulator [Acidobacteriota bacterium]
MPKPESRKILAVIEDLFFTVKVKDAAARAGLSVDFVKNTGDIVEKAGQKPLVIIVDLNIGALDPVQLVQNLKTTEDTKRIPVIAYVSHVQGELKQKAHEAGCDIVMARSAFSQNLPQILRRHAGLA